MDTFSLSNIRTARQSQAIQFWIDGGRKSKAEALRKAGYSEAVVRHPERVFGSPSVQQELELRGLGRDGFGIPKPMPAEILVEEDILPTSPVYSFNPQEIPTEQLQELKEKLRAIGYEPTSPRATTEPIRATPMTLRNNLGCADVLEVSAEKSFPNMSSM
ncbi:MAG: hypothetical protein OQJ98_01450 [Candidatus Pacebacteria bacterium]|nr:hypothetical protein [Candidatus Paceibacterota bacterium]